MMHFLKPLFPANFKQPLKQWVRNTVSLLNGTYLKFASTKNSNTHHVLLKQIKQPLNIAATAKKHNLQIAINAVNNITIQPNEIFSFWHLIGNPTKNKGYMASRAITGNEIKQQIGGGLCQLSGLIYYLALHAGVQIIERHHHSIDIYTEEERFTPLGSDATVVYGYKDLQFKNNFPFTISLSFIITATELVGSILATQQQLPLQVHFSYVQQATHTEVTTTVLKEHTILTNEKKVYKK
jgi:vancomycin resistance protein VanW